MTSEEFVAPTPSILLSADEQRIERLKSSASDFKALINAPAGHKKFYQFLLHQFRSYYFVLPPMWRIYLRMANWENRMIPQFTSTGSIRSGTSNLSNYIMQHPCVVLPLAKELAGYIPKMSFARAQFPTNKQGDVVKAQYGHAITGSCTPILPSHSLCYWTKAINPEMKFVIMLRNPVDRVFSHWRWNKMIAGIFSNDPLWQFIPDFATSMRIEIEDLRDGGCGFQLFSGAGYTSYLRHSIYFPFLREITKIFGADKIMVINADEFFVDPLPKVQQVYRFLGLPAYQPIDIGERNAAPAMEFDERLRGELVEFFKPYNQQLYEFLGTEFDWH